MPPASRAYLLSTVAAAALATAHPASAQRIGVSGAVNPATVAAPPGQPDKTLLVGENIVFNEHISTGPDGQTQILFVDESAMSIGPNSDMTIDEFVYNPKTGTGTEALSATRGVFRYVGGKLSKGATPVTIKTPVATIGIRGGVFVMDLDPDGKLDVVFLYGTGLTVTGLNGATESITRPGFGVTVNGRGAGPSSPTAVHGSTLSSYITLLDGHGGSSGGASQIPTDATVVNSGVPQTVSGNLVNSVQAAIQSQSQSQTQTQTVTPPAQNNLNTTQSQSQPAITQSINNSNSPPLSQFGVTGGGVAINAVTNQNGFTNPITPFTGGSIKDGVFVASFGVDSLTLLLNQGTGTIAGPTGSFPVVGTPFVNTDGSFFYSNLAIANDPTKIGFVYGGQAPSQSTYNQSSTVNFNAYQIQPDAALQSSIPFTTNAVGGMFTNPVASVSPLYLMVPTGTGLSAGSNSFTGPVPSFLQASLGINGTGATQSSALLVAVGQAVVVGSNPGQPALSGTVEGSYRPDGTTPQTLISSSLSTGVDVLGNSFYGNNSVEGFALTPESCCTGNAPPVAALATATNTQNNATSSYGFVQPAVQITPPAIANGPQTQPTLVGLFGGTMVGTTNGNSVPYAVSGAAVITYPTSLQIAAALVGSDPFTSSQSGVNSLTLVYGNLLTGNTNHQAYINDNLFGLLEVPGGGTSAVNSNLTTSANLYMVDSNAVPNNPLLPATGLCQCQYLQWGYWGGELDTGSGSSARTDIGHINTWVAGTWTPTADLNNLSTLGASATYSGNAIGTVNNNGASYLATGTYSETYHFGTSTGTISINNFDNNNFTGRVAGGAGSPIYAGSLSNGSNLSGTAEGYFFGPQAAETGGNFAVHSITGLPYQAAGVFAGKKP